MTKYKHKRITVWNGCYLYDSGNKLDLSKKQQRHFCIRKDKKSLKYSFGSKFYLIHDKTNKKVRLSDTILFGGNMIPYFDKSRPKQISVCDFLEELYLKEKSFGKILHIKNM